MESRRRSLAKALSWRVIALAVTTGLGYALTNSATFAISIGIADSLIKIFAYYMHERAWMKLRFGREPRRVAASRGGEVEPLVTSSTGFEDGGVSRTSRPAAMRRAC